VARPPKESVPPKPCGCFQFPHKKGPEILVCFRPDYWGALSQDQRQDPHICSEVHKVTPTMGQITHYNRFVSAVQLAAKDFKGKDVAEWREAVSHAYKHPQEFVPKPPASMLREPSKGKPKKAATPVKRVRERPKRAWRK
jgi:hypothetical protein